MRSIPELVDAVAGVPEAIAPYDDEDSQYRSVADAVSQMQVPAILVCHESSELRPAPGSDFPRWSHSFQVYFRFERSSEAWAAIDPLINGVPDAADGSPWIERDIAAGLWPPMDPEIGYVRNPEGIELPRLSFRTWEIGG